MQYHWSSLAPPSCLYFLWEVCYWYFSSTLSSFLEIYACLFCQHARMCITCMSGACRGHWIPRNWSYEWLWVTVWVLGNESRSSARAANILNCYPSLQPLVSFCPFCLYFDYSLFHCTFMCYITVFSHW